MKEHNFHIHITSTAVVFDGDVVDDEDDDDEGGGGDGLGVAER